MTVLNSWGWGTLSNYSLIASSLESSIQGVGVVTIQPNHLSCHPRCCPSLLQVSHASFESSLLTSQLLNKWCITTVGMSQMGTWLYIARQSLGSDIPHSANTLNPSNQFSYLLSHETGIFLSLTVSAWPTIQQPSCHQPFSNICKVMNYLLLLLLLLLLLMNITKFSLFYYKLFTNYKTQLLPHPASSLNGWPSLRSNILHHAICPPVLSKLSTDLPIFNKRFGWLVPSSLISTLPFLPTLNWPSLHPTARLDGVRLKFQQGRCATLSWQTSGHAAASSLFSWSVWNKTGCRRQCCFGLSCWWTQTPLCNLAYRIYAPCVRRRWDRTRWLDPSFWPRWHSKTRTWEAEEQDCWGTRRQGTQTAGSALSRVAGRRRI